MVITGRLGFLKDYLRYGVVTEKYPYEPVPTPETFRGKPVIDTSKCLGCGACVNACPANALSIEDDLKEGIRWVRLFIGRCIYCGRCADACPVNAISLSREFELSTLENEELFQEVGLRMVRCVICGKPFTTYRLVKEVMKGLEPDERPLLLVCPECRAKLAARNASFARW